MAYIGSQPSNIGDAVLTALASGNIPIDMTNSATGALQVAGGTNAQRPTGANGKLRFNSETGAFEGFATTWGQVATSNVATTFSKPQKSQTLALTHNTVWDGTDKQHLTVNVNGSSFTIANPSSHINGTYYVIFVTYTTSHTLAFGNAFKGIADLIPTASAGSFDHFAFRSDGTNLHLVGAAYNTGA